VVLQAAAGREQRLCYWAGGCQEQIARSQSSRFLQMWYIGPWVIIIHLGILLNPEATDLNTGSKLGGTVGGRSRAVCSTHVDPAVAYTMSVFKLKHTFRRF
jgi:hypothetical protein